MGSMERGLNRAPKQIEKEEPPMEGVYSVSAPMDREAGEPLVQITLGKPNKVERLGLLIPGGFDRECLTFNLELPVMINVGGKRVDAIAKGSVSSEHKGKEFSFIGLDMALPEGVEEIDPALRGAIGAAFEKQVGPRGGEQLVSDALIHEIELLCVAERDKIYAGLEK